ncbi:hypothetical protein FOZ62_017532, partial [Perkinsus olseni]
PTWYHIAWQSCEAESYEDDLCPFANSSGPCREAQEMGCKSLVCIRSLERCDIGMMLSRNIIRCLSLVVLVSSNPPPPDGAFSTMPADDVCIQVTWTNRPRKEVTLGVMCGGKKQQCFDLTVEKNALSGYKIDNASWSSYNNFRGYVNERCGGYLVMRPDNLATFTYNTALGT